jgi:hypothetical protein
MMKIEQSSAYITLTTNAGLAFCYNIKDGKIYKWGIDTDGAPIMRPATKKQKDAVMQALIYRHIGIYS